MGPLCTGSVGSNVKDPGVQMERIRGFKYKGSGGSNIKDPGVQMYPGSFTFEPPDPLYLNPRILYI